MGRYVGLLKLIMLLKFNITFKISMKESQILYRSNISKSTLSQLKYSFAELKAVSVIGV